MNCTIRAFEKNDVFNASAIDLAAQQHASPWNAPTFSNWISHCPGIYLALDIGGSLAGYLLLSIAGDEAEILTLAIAPKYQHQGFGSLLIQKALEQVRAQSIKIVFLEVNEKNTAAHTLYQKLGFASVSIRKKYYKTAPNQYDDAIIMKKKLL